MLFIRETDLIRTLKPFFLVVDIGFILYWTVTLLHLIPEAYLFKDYDGPRQKHRPQHERLLLTSSHRAEHPGRDDARQDVDEQNSHIDAQRLHRGRKTAGLSAGKAPNQPL